MARFFNLHQTTGLLQVHVAEQRATNRPIFNKRKFRVRHDACFYLGPFANEYTEIYQEHIRKPLSKCGIEVKRADEVYNVRPVMDSFWESMNQSATIIVELSGRNPNVLYEIGWHML